MGTEVLNQYIVICEVIESSSRRSELKASSCDMPSNFPIIDVAFPMAVGIYNTATEIRSIFGIETLIASLEEFNEKFYSRFLKRKPAELPRIG